MEWKSPERSQEERRGTVKRFFFEKEMTFLLFFSETETSLFIKHKKRDLSSNHRSIVLRGKGLGENTN